jgi:hypothetical protein
VDETDPSVSQVIRSITNPPRADHPLPDDWTLIPGVVDVKTNIIDHPETITDRLERVASTVDAAHP